MSIRIEKNPDGSVLAVVVEDEHEHWNVGHDQCGTCGEPMLPKPMTDDQLDRLICHAEYGHLEGQEYDLIVQLVAEVRRLRQTATEENGTL